MKLLSVLASSMLLLPAALLSSSAGESAYASPDEVERFRFEPVVSRGHAPSFRLVSGQGKPAPVSAELASGIEEYAAVTGDSAKALIDRHQGVDLFTELLNQFSTDYPESYVSAGRSREGEPGNYWFAFTTDPGEDVTRQLSLLPVDSAVWTGLPATASQRDSLMAELSRVLHETVDVKDFKVSSDERVSSLTVEFSTVDRNAAEVAGEVASELDARLADSGRVRALPLQFEEVAVTGTSPTALVRGGYGFAGCTTGFTGVRAGQTGVTLAGHCANSGLWEGGAAGVIQHIFDAANVDVAWFRTQTENGHTTAAQYRSHQNQIDSVLGVGDPGLNVTVCKYGKTTDHGCAQTLQGPFCASQSGTYYCDLIMLDLAITQGGIVAVRFSTTITHAVL